MDLYLDNFSGISGDMMLGALIDLGADITHIERELRKLALTGYTIQARKAVKSGISGTKFDVILEADSGSNIGNEPHHDHDHDHDHSDARDFSQIKGMIESSGLSDWVIKKSVSVFERIARAEGKVHGKRPEEVHFHEVGAVDSIVDIVGSCLALEQMGRPNVLSGPIREGTGFVECAHGRYPVPVAATLEIFAERGVGFSQCEEPHEMVTPTGAALLAEFASEFAMMRDFEVHKIGYGLGTRDFVSRPNVLRVVLGVKTKINPFKEVVHGWEVDEQVVVETNLDDLAPECLAPMIQACLDEGALDAWQTSVVMKKSRVGVLLSVLTPGRLLEKIVLKLLTHTSAFGVRYYPVTRCKLKRESRVVATRFGPVRVKTGYLNENRVQVSPEFEDCARIAREMGIPIRTVYRAAESAFDSNDQV